MKICMLAYTFYDQDNRVRRYAEALAKDGHCVDVVALKSPGGDSFNKLFNVNIYKIQERKMNEKGKLSYLYRILLFFFRSFLFITKRHLLSPYNLIHVHSVPDFEVFAAIIPKIMGAKIILDIHDIVPEFFSTKFHSTTNSLQFKALLWVEKLSCRFSDHVIISNHLWYKKIVKRSVKEDKCTVILNYPDTTIFKDNPNKSNSIKTQDVILLYPGSLNWYQGLDIAIQAFALIKDKVPQSKFLIYGSGPSEKYLKDMIIHLNLEGRVTIKKPVSLETVSQIMCNTSIGVIPKRNNSFSGEAFSTKILEFMTLQVPILISRTKIDAHYFNDDIVTFFEPDNIKDLSIQILEMIKNFELRRNQAKRALCFVKDYQWDKNQNIYFDLIGSLIK